MNIMKKKNKTNAKPTPTLRLHLNDLRHPGSILFLSLLPNVEAVLETALTAIVEHLYTSPAAAVETKRPHWTFTPSIPPTRSVTLVLRDFPGVAYTTGSESDNDDKEIHFSLGYIYKCSEYADPVSELAGVLTHELVHCYQHTAPPPSSPGAIVPQPPGGLIEGIADFVRLKASLVPPHWKRPVSSKDRPPNWDQGYQHTAFFLAWLEDVRAGRGTIGMLNDRLLRIGYINEGDERNEAAEQDNHRDHTHSNDNNDQSSNGSTTEGNGFWNGVFGVGVLQLWEEYGRFLDGQQQSSERTDECEDGESAGLEKRQRNDHSNNKADWEVEILNLE
jgi:Peptidase of plants and bacteria